jgi:hypothetical protein
VDAVEPSVGWGVLHLFYKVDRTRAEADTKAGKRILDAVQSLVDDGHQALLFVVLGHKADLGVMVLGPDLARLQSFQHELAATPLTLVDSYVSLTELSEYTSTEDDERTRLRSVRFVPRPCLHEVVVQTGDRIVSAPTVANGVVYVASTESDHHVYALEAKTSVLRWKYQTGWGYFAPVVANGLAYVASNDGYLYALDA